MKFKPYTFNQQYFERLLGSDYEALKKDIEKNGIKTELHVLPDWTVICGNQRLRVALEIGLLEEEIPYKIISHLKNDDEIKEYVIKDNLLRRHLKPEHKALLEYELYKIRFKFQEKDDSGKFLPLSKNKTTDIYKDIGDEVGSNRSTIAQHIQYAKVIEQKPELRDKKISEVLRLEVKNYFEECDLSNVSKYDNNIYYFKSSKFKRASDDFLKLLEEAKNNNMKLYNGQRLELFKMNQIPCLTRVGEMFHEDGNEFSIREYADVQDFPHNYKFVGNRGTIKDQIGEAVSPKMGKYIIDKYIKGSKFIELFCGAGGFSANLKNNAIWAIDFNKYAIYSYKLNNPETIVEIDDIKKVDAEALSDILGNIDFIIGGPPCQGFSSVGKQIGFKEDTRNSLYLEFIRFVKAFQPKQFIMENVKEILDYKNEIINDFNKIGYNIQTELVNGLEIGMKQKRIRAFFIGDKQ